MTVRFASICALSIFSGIIVFHLLVLFGAIPYDIVWGGRIENTEQMIVFEIISISLNALMIAIVCIRAGLIRLNINPAVVKYSLLAMGLLFCLNTVGNLYAENELEKMIFTPVTALLAILSFRLAKGY